jgi:hypothetical protein
MAKGMFIMQWSERAGMDIVAECPATVDLPMKTLMQIYSTHEYSGQLGMISLQIGNANLASYYFSKEKGYYLGLILDDNEEADDFEEGLAEVTRIINQNLDGNKFLPLFPSLFRLLASYPTLKPEQRLAMVYLDETKRKVITRLREEGSIPRTELELWLKDISKGVFLDVENVVNTFLKVGLVKLTAVASVADIIFLAKDIAIYRTPPISLITDVASRGLPGVLKGAYQKDVKDFFATYKPSEEDNLNLLGILTDLDAFGLLSILREKVVTWADLQRITALQSGQNAACPTDSLEVSLKKLWDARVITVLKDIVGTEFYCLRSDIIVTQFLAKFMLNVVLKSAMEHTKSDIILFEHLDLLETAFKGVSGVGKRPAKEVEALAK